MKYHINLLKESDDSERELELELLQAFSCFSEAYNYVKKNNPSGLKCFVITTNPNLKAEQLPFDSEPTCILFDVLSQEEKVEFYKEWMEEISEK